MSGSSTPPERSVAAANPAPAKAPSALPLPRLEEEPYEFQFFQAARLLHRLAPQRSPVGEFVDPSNEVVRFSANPSLSFPAGEIEDLEPRRDGGWKMTVNFLGLIGHLGVLPNHYSLLVKRRMKARDNALRDFLDIFHHRVVSLFYRAMERARFYVPYERRESDALTSHLLDFLGIGEEAARAALDLDECELLGYVGLLGRTPRSALALEQLIEGRFGVPVAVEQFVGGWYDVSDTSQCRVDDTTSDHSQRLGVGALVGDEIWDPQARARIVLGPLSRPQYEAFLPTGPYYEKLRSISRFFASEVEFELLLILEPEEVQPLRLGSDDSPALGWGTWIRSGQRAPETAETALPL